MVYQAGKPAESRDPRERRPRTEQRLRGPESSRVTCRLKLYESSRAGLHAQAATAASDVLRAGQKTLTFGLDNLSNISDDAVAALIVALRRMREDGGTIALETTNAKHHQALLRSGLDRIVSIETYALAA